MSQNQERVETAIADPTKVFASPMDVVNDATLQFAEKRIILDSWKKDAELLSTAQGENMAGGECNQMQEVSLALEQLDKLSGARH